MKNLLLTCWFILPRGENVQYAKFQERTKDDDGNIVGTFKSKLILNTILYDVEFLDGTVKKYSANVISENMYSQVDYDGHTAGILDNIVDYSKDDTAVPISEKYVTTCSGDCRLLHTTKDCHLLVQWKDGSEQWVFLKLLKKHNHVEIAEFSHSRNISYEPAFCWWVPYTLRKQYHIIATVNARFCRTTHKYGIEVPNPVDHAKRIDASNGNCF